jgi:TIR domain
MATASKHKEPVGAMATGTVPFVFVCYSHADKKLVRVLSSALKSRGARIWIDEIELKVGDSIIERITTAIAKADFFLAVVSKSSGNSIWWKKELALAITGELRRGRIRVLPVRVDGAPMPAVLEDIYYLDLSAQGVEEVADRIMDAISEGVQERADNRADREPLKVDRTSLRFVNQAKSPQVSLDDFRNVPLSEITSDEIGLNVALARVLGQSPMHPVRVAEFLSAI